MFVLGKKLQKLNTKKATNKDLLKWINKFEQQQILVHDPRGPMWFLETPFNLLSKYPDIPKNSGGLSVKI